MGAGSRRWGLALLVVPLCAAASVQCPPALKVEQRAIEVPAGMRGFDSQPSHQWVNAQFSDGAPEEEAWLAPDSTRRQGKAFVNTWRFGKAPNGTWLSCNYQGTSIALTFRLPDTVTQCDLRYDGTVSPPAATALTCR